MTRFRRCTPAVFGAVLVAASMTGPAASAGEVSSADLAAVRDFQLTPRFLRSYEGYEEEAAKKPCELSPFVVLSKVGKKSRSLDAAAAAFDAQPGVHDALQRNGLGARELLIGISAWMAAASKDLGEHHPELVKRGMVQSDIKVSADNLAFYREHKDEFRQHQRKLGREQLARNGGRLPPCLSNMK